MGHAGESLSLWDSDRKKPRLLISFPLKHRFPTDVLSSGFFRDLSEALSLVSSASFIHHLPAWMDIIFFLFISQASFIGSKKMIRSGLETARPVY